MVHNIHGPPGPHQTRDPLWPRSRHRTWDPPALKPLLVGPHCTAPSPLVLTSGGYRSRVGKRAVHILLECSLVFTTRKRSLGQGNVFTRVCHSVHGEGGVDFPACITGHMTSIRGVGLPACTAGHMIVGVSASRGRGSTYMGDDWADPPPPTHGTGGTHPIGMLPCCFWFFGGKCHANNGKFTPT